MKVFQGRYTGGPDYEYAIRFYLSRLDFQKNVNFLRYKRITESLISPIILNKMNSLSHKQIKVSQGKQGALITNINTVLLYHV